MSIDSSNIVAPAKLQTEKTTLNQFLKHLSTCSVLEYIIDILPKCSVDGPWIAGGSLHRTYKKLSMEHGDIDVFFKNEDQLNKFIRDINANALDSKLYTTVNYVVSEWHHTLTIKYLNIEWKIQCVSFKYFDTIEDLFQSFDINICRIAYDGENVVFEKNVLNQINNNDLKFNGASINYPSVTLKRLVKYVKMGYNIEDSELKTLTHAFYRSKKKAIDVLDQDFLTKKHSPINNYEGLK